METLKMIFNSCQQLESIRVWCGYDHDYNYLNESNIHYKGHTAELFPERLEPVFISWANRIPRKSLSLTVFRGSESLGIRKEGMKVIENLKMLDVINLNIL